MLKKSPAKVKVRVAEGTVRNLANRRFHAGASANGTEVPGRMISKRVKGHGRLADMAGICREFDLGSRVQISKTDCSSS